MLVVDKRSRPAGAAGTAVDRIGSVDETRVVNTDAGPSPSTDWAASWGALAVLTAVVVGLFAYAYTNAYDDDATCSALLVDRYGVPGQVCDGAIDEESTAGQVVGRAADMVGVDTGDTLVPGIAPIIDGPLETVRRLGVAVFLLLLLLVALLISVLVGSARFLGRLLARDPQTWRRLLIAGRSYLLVVLGLYGLSVLLFRPF